MNNEHRVNAFFSAGLADYSSCTVQVATNQVITSLFCILLYYRYRHLGPSYVHHFFFLPLCDVGFESRVPSIFLFHLATAVSRFHMKDSAFWNFVNPGCSYSRSAAISPSDRPFILGALWTTIAERGFLSQATMRTITIRLF
jgi:hypothetical protein